MAFRQLGAKLQQVTHAQATTCHRWSVSGVWNRTNNTRRKSDLFDYKNAFPTLQSFELEKFVTIWSTVGPPYRDLGTPYIF